MISVNALSSSVISDALYLLESAASGELMPELGGLAEPMVALVTTRWALPPHLQSQHPRARAAAMLLSAPDLAPRLEPELTPLARLADPRELIRALLTQPRHDAQLSEMLLRLPSRLLRDVAPSVLAGGVRARSMAAARLALPHSDEGTHRRAASAFMVLDAPVWEPLVTLLRDALGSDEDPMLLSEVETLEDLLARLGAALALGECAPPSRVTELVTHLVAKEASLVASAAAPS